jgi:hypothetical protein
VSTERWDARRSAHGETESAVDSSIIRDRLVADTVIRTLAASEADLLERVADLERDNVTLRELVREAIHALHAVTKDRDRQRDGRITAINEIRDLRARLKTADAQIATLHDDLRACRRGRAA